MFAESSRQLFSSSSKYSGQGPENSSTRKYIRLPFVSASDFQFGNVIFRARPETRLPVHPFNDNRFFFLSIRIYKDWR